MTLYDLKAFFRFLSDASTAELRDRQQALRAELPLLKEEAVIRQARYYLKSIEEEILSRQVFHRDGPPSS